MFPLIFNNKKYEPTEKKAHISHRAKDIEEEEVVVVALSSRDN